jgi:hypothetical protein
LPERERVDLLVLRERPPPLAGPPASPTDWPPRFAHLPLAAVPAGEQAPPGLEEIGRYPHYPVQRMYVVKGADWLLSVERDVVNLSLGPDASGPFDPHNPLHVATRALVDAGTPVVVAAGNDGPDDDTMQELARAPWVIPVGATDADGSLLAASSRGAPGGTGPTVVSDGTHPEEPVPGTSFAAPRVAHAALFARKCLEYLLGCAGWVVGDERDPFGPTVRLPWLGILDTGWDPVKAPYSWGPLARATIESGSDAVQITVMPEEERWLERVLAALGYGQRDFDLDAGPETVRRAVVAMARRMPGAPHAVGAGFVTIDNALAFFGAFTPSRLAAVLLPGDEQAQERLPGLDEELGSLWSETKLAIFDDYFATGVRLSVGRVI